MAVQTGVAARASAVQERPLAVGPDWPWTAQPDDDAARPPSAVAGGRDGGNLR